jgi:hypothetical protein
MTGQGSERPNELIEHAPVTLRRFRADDLDALFRAGHRHRRGLAPNQVSTDQVT